MKQLVQLVARRETEEAVGYSLSCNPAPLRQKNMLPAFPFGSDFSEGEQQLLPALTWLKQANAGGVVACVCCSRRASRAHLRRAKPRR